MQRKSARDMIAYAEVAEIAALTSFFLAAVAILLLVFRGEPKILKGRKGWLIIAFALLLFGVRVYMHFLEEYWLQVLRRLIGIADSFLFPAGLYLIYRDFRGRK